MQDRRFSPLLIVGFVAAALIMGGVGWYLSGPGEPIKPAPPPQKEMPKDDLAQKSALGPAAPEPTPMVDQPPTMVARLPGNTSEEQRRREAADQKVGMLLAQNPTVEGARKKLLLMFPGFSREEKVAAAPHIVNLVGDEQISTVVGFLKSPLTPIEAQETFFNDMLNRPPQVGWPVLVDIIATPNHPLAQRAKELLSTIVGGDHGNDAGAWLQGVYAQLKQQGIDVNASANQPAAAPADPAAAPAPAPADPTAAPADPAAPPADPAANPAATPDQAQAPSN